MKEKTNDFVIIKIFVKNISKNKYLINIKIWKHP
jgi:hypothetical protein